MAVQSAVSVLLVAVRADTEARSLAVAIARFSMDLTISFLVGVVGRLIGMVA